jgi:hypothetical protein
MLASHQGGRIVAKDETDRIRMRRAPVAPLRISHDGNHAGDGRLLPAKTIDAWRVMSIKRP